MSLILSGDTGVPVTTVTGTLPVANGGTGVTTAIDYGFKNRIINGSMVIDQRNAGASVTPTNGQYTVDRFEAIMYATAGKYTVQQNAGAVTPPVGFMNYLGVTSSSAYSIASGDIYGFRQAIEGYNIADLGWGTANAKTITLSFQVYSSLTGTFGGSLQNSAQNRSYPFSYSVPAANTWTTISVTIAGDTSGTWLTTNGNGMRVFWGLGVGSTFSGTAGAWSGNQYYSATGATSVVGTNGATFYITGVQLEKGSTATSFDYRPYGTELALAQRYYQQSTPAGGQLNFCGAYCRSAIVIESFGTQFVVQMRATPTLTTISTFNFFSGLVNSAVSSIAIGAASNSQFSFTATIAAGTAGSAGQLFGNTSTSNLQFSAEL